MSSELSFLCILDSNGIGHSSLPPPRPLLSHRLLPLPSSYSSSSSFVLSLDGPASIRNGPLTKSSSSSGVGNDSNPSTPPLPFFQNSFQAIARAVRAIYDPQEKASSSSQASSSSSAYRPPHRFSLRYLNIVDPVDVANNLGISVSLKNSKAIQMILFHASQHLESLHCWSMSHHASRVPSSPSSSHPPQQPALHLSAPHPSYGNVA